MLKLTAAAEHWPMKEPFSISGYTFTHFDVLAVTLEKGGVRGRGEAAGVYYRGETPQTMMRQIEAVRLSIESGISRDALRAVLPPGGARCALDAALWDLEAKLTGVPVHRRAGVQELRPLPTTYTVGADTPARMAQVARAYSAAPRLKLKLTGEDDVARVRAVRAARPEAWIGIDANQGLTRPSLRALLPALEELDVKLIEQPLPVGHESELRGLRTRIALAADESVQCLADLASVAGLFDVVNVKLDKCGGLTEGLQMLGQIRRLGMTAMVGCMSGTSLAITPAFVLGQHCQIVDLDAPLLLAEDREPVALYARGMLRCAAHWGFPGGPVAPAR